MANASSIGFQARQLASSTHNADVKKLAELISQLCREVEDVEKLAKEAEDEARRAKRG